MLWFMFSVLCIQQQNSLLTLHRQGRYGRVLSGRWCWTRKPPHQQVCWSTTGSCDRIQVIYQAAQVVYPQTSFVLQDYFQVHSCIHAISWHNLLGGQQDPQVARQKQPRKQWTALLNAWMLWWAHLIEWKPQIEHIKIICSNRVRSQYNLEGVMLCWLDQFLAGLLQKCGTCCCRHSLLSVCDWETSLLF